MRAPRILLTVAVAAAMTLPAGGALAAAEPPPTCGATVSGAVTLTRDLVCPDGRGLTLLAGAVLDLNGHRLVGPGPGPGSGPGSGQAVTVEPGQSASVRNGTIEGWGTAIGSESGLGAADGVSAIRAVTFQDNDTGVRTGGGMDYVIEGSQFVGNRSGISTFNAQLTVRESVFVANDTAASIFFGGAHRFEDSTFTRNDLAIDCVNVRLAVERSTFTRNGFGVGAFECSEVRLVDSTLTGNGTAYSTVLSNGSDQVLRNTFVNNDVAFDARSGGDVADNRFIRNEIAVRAPADNPPTGPAFLTLERNRLIGNADAIVLDSPSELGGNVAIANRGYGIFAPQAIDLGGNVAFRNGREPQCTGVVCSDP